jgi:hypothetical protein
MVNEQTSQAIVTETEWLVHGQEKKIPIVDEYNRKMFRFEHTKSPMAMREALALATQRARDWSFQCPDVPSKPADFQPA